MEFDGTANRMFGSAIEILLFLRALRVFRGPMILGRMAIGQEIAAESNEIPESPIDS